MNVTILVISYNSAKTIIETLNSIKKQTYNLKLIDLVISDDFSMDNTIRVAEEWVLLNEGSFNSVRFCLSKSNGGVAKNINSGLEYVTSEWFKLIAADDVLEEKCISVFVDFVEANPCSKAVFSLVSCFDDNSESLKVLPAKCYREYFNFSPKLQLLELIKGNFVIAPSQFLHVKTIKDAGGFNERFTLFEDLPMWIVLSEKGIKLDLIPLVLVKYRIANSISHSSNRLFNESLLAQKKQFLISNIYPLIQSPIFLITLKVDNKIEFLIEKFVMKFMGNKKNTFTVTFVNVASFFRPLYFSRKIARLSFYIKSVFRREKC